jgi:small-conductance mechanosensitive channel
MATKEEKNLRQQAVTEIFKLMTASFGLIAALAWNQVVQELVKSYIQPLFGKNSGIISLFIYAIIVTILAVTITYFLSRFVKND